MSKLNENLSTLMDGNVDDITLARLCQDDELKDSWENYHLIRDTLKGELPNKVNLDLSSSIQKALEAEESYELSPKSAHKPLWNSTFKRMGGMAIAASVAFAIVLGVDMYNGPVDTTSTGATPLANTIDSPVSQQPATLTQATVAHATDAMSDEERKRLATYLEKHTTQSVKRQLDKKPYVRVVNYKYQTK
jgi:sigma-E factor negative regulatory protein RseA